MIQEARELIEAIAQAWPDPGQCRTLEVPGVGVGNEDYFGATMTLNGWSFGFWVTGGMRTLDGEPFAMVHIRAANGLSWREPGVRVIDVDKVGTGDNTVEAIVKWCEKRSKRYAVDPSEVLS